MGADSIALIFPCSNGKLTAALKPKDHFRIYAILNGEGASGMVPALRLLELLSAW